MYRVELESKARRAFLALPKDIAGRIADALDDLQKDPRPPGAKKLSGLEGYRVRVGDYRVLYAVTDAHRLVRVYVIGHRRDVYRRSR